MNEIEKKVPVHKGTIYYTVMPQGQTARGLDHMVGEKLLGEALLRERGTFLRFEPRGKGEHGKPFFTMCPNLHYNISHSGCIVACIMADCEVGLDVQILREAGYAKVMKYLVPEALREEILASEDVQTRFFEQWVLREAYVKWTGEGLTKKLSDIDLETGWHTLLGEPLPEGYMGAVYAALPMELRWERVPMPAL